MKYIAICGTVGSGKTTMLGKLLDHFGARASFHEERPQDNPFICDYYADSKRWTFHAQVSFLSLYFDDPAWKPENAKTELFFFDRCFWRTSSSRATGWTRETSRRRSLTRLRSSRPASIL